MDNENDESSFLHSPDFQRMLKCEELVYSLTEENFESIMKATMDFLNSSSTRIFARTLLSRIYIDPNQIDLYLLFLKKHDDLQRVKGSQVFLISPFVKALFHQQVDPNLATPGLIDQSVPQFVIQKLLNLKIIDRNQIAANDKCLDDLYGHPYDAMYFMHLLDFSNSESNKQLLLEFNQIYMSNEFLRRNFQVLSKNNFELHKKFVNSGSNPDPLSNILKTDNIEKFQKYLTKTPIKLDSSISNSIYESNKLVRKCQLIEFCAFYGSVNCFYYLLSNGVKPTERLPLYAIAGGDQRIISAIEKIPGVAFKNCLSYAIAFHRFDLFKWLFDEKHVTIDSNHLSTNCIFYCSFTAMKELLLKGCNPSFFLLSAAQFDFIECVKMFLQMSQIQPDIVMNGCTPLIYAAMNNNFEMARILIELGNADFNFCDPSGRTALHYACKNGNMGFVQYLLEKPGINPDDKADTFKYTPLSFACIYGHYDIVDLLLEREDINFQAAVVAMKNAGKGNFGYILQKLGLEDDSINLDDSEEDF